MRGFLGVLRARSCYVLASGQSGIYATGASILGWFMSREKHYVIVGVSDEKGLGWACAKRLASTGARVTVACWVPLYKLFKEAFEGGKLDEARRLQDGSLMELTILPLDARFDVAADVPAEISAHKRYQGVQGYSIAEFCAAVTDGPMVSGWVHALANAPEIRRPLLETTRQGYLDAISSSSYSLIALLRGLGPHMEPGAGVVTLTYRASSQVVPGYGGGMSSAKAALESDVKTLAYEAGRRWGVRVNAISAGPWKSRAAQAIGKIDLMVDYARKNAPLAKDMDAADVAHAAHFLLSEAAACTTGTILWTDCGLHCMALPVDAAQH